MKILILAAMQKEIELLLNILKNFHYRDCNGIRIYEGNICNHKIAVAKCGIGKVNSAVNTFFLINALNPDLVINSGVAGGAGVPVGSILIPDKVAYHDVWCGPGTEYGQANGFPLFMQTSPEILDLIKELDLESPIIYGLICSGDKFISTPEEIRFIKSKFPEVKAVDMESASIAQTCIMSKTPFAIIRIVSDTPGEGENISQYESFWSKAPETTFQILNLIIRSLK